MIRNPGVIIKNQDKENRRFTRFEFVSTCTILVNKTRKELSAKILNVSTSGLYIKCIDECVGTGEIIVVTFTVEKDGISSVASFEGKVVRADKDGLGLEITKRDFSLYSKFIDIMLMANEDSMKIKSSIYNSEDFEKKWKGGFVRL